MRPADFQAWKDRLKRKRKCPSDLFAEALARRHAKRVYASTVLVAVVASLQRAGDLGERCSARPPSPLPIYRQRDPGAEASGGLPPKDGTLTKQILASTFPPLVSEHVNKDQSIGIYRPL